MFSYTPSAFFVWISNTGRSSKQFSSNNIYLLTEMARLIDGKVKQQTLQPLPHFIFEADMQPDTFLSHLKLIYWGIYSFHTARYTRQIMQRLPGQTMIPLCCGFTTQGQLRNTIRNSLATLYILYILHEWIRFRSFCLTGCFNSQNNTCGLEDSSDRLSYSSRAEPSPQTCVRPPLAFLSPRLKSNPSWKLVWFP